MVFNSIEPFTVSYILNVAPLESFTAGSSVLVILSFDVLEYKFNSPFSTNIPLVVDDITKLFVVIVAIPLFNIRLFVTPSPADVK